MAWIQGAYMRVALASTPVIMGMKKGELPKFPNMPFEDEIVEQQKKDEEWLQKEREKAYSGFVALLSNCKNAKKG